MNIRMILIWFQRLNWFIFTDSCEENENGRFSVKFHNSAKFPIDVKLYDNNNLVLQLVKSALGPEAEYTRQASFQDRFAFTKSNTIDRLNVSANGIMAFAFNGCQFEAEEGGLITVYISGGKTWP